MQTHNNNELHLDPTRIPRHIAIIMDGNGRWAKARGLDRSVGHQKGVETVHTITEEAARIGVQYLTLYAFSTENWNRPAAEVAALMSLVLSSLEESLFMNNNVRLLLIGDTARLPEEICRAVKALEEKTARNTGLTLIVALSYSSKWEIIEAVRSISAKAAAGEVKPEEITEVSLSDSLTTAGIPDPDLLIRTGGEIRLSNFLLWQCAYSELYFCDTYWPDFGREDFHRAISEYQHRERRYGKTGEQVAAEPSLQE
ncbi:MAG: isoprenyl transferase [Bacteroidaceae bacterium]|nr:isoprenyl transferase [Bacteroidaceae bacterium]